MLVTDIESDGLLDVVSKFHCGTIIDYFDRSNKIRYLAETFGDYVARLEEEMAKPDGLVVFHNGIGYDMPALDIIVRKLLGRPFVYDQSKVLDTLVLSRLIFSNLKDTDVALMRSGKISGKEYGRHSLKAWGMRLGEHKGDYTGGWEAYSEEMGDYCDQDVEVTCCLLDKIFANSHYFTAEGNQLVEAIRLEHKAAWILAEMTRNGFPFDAEGGEKLYAELSAERQNMLMDLVDTFGSWYKAGGKAGREVFRHPVSGKGLDKYPLVIYPKAGELRTKDGKGPLAKTQYYKDRPYTPVEYVTFSPSSRAHLLKVLQEAGWVPTEFTDVGNAIVDDEQLSMIQVSDPHKQKCIDMIRRYLMLQKLIGMVAEGKAAWLALNQNGKMHGSINPNGAVTGRATHSHPNMGQVPSSGKNKEFGPRCRALFGAVYHKTPDGKPAGWVQVGTDAAGLELRCLGHFVHRYDEGAYIDVILNGDIHTTNQIAAGLPTRDNAKTFIYGWLYGAGAAKLGEIVGGSAVQGKALIKSFLEKLPAVASLREAVQDTLVESSKWVGGVQQTKWRRKWIKGLDGRRIHVRSPHSALNSLLQSAGALICKLWLIEVYERLLALGLKSGWSGDFSYMAWVHKHHCAR